MEVGAGSNQVMLKAVVIATLDIGGQHSPSLLVVVVAAGITVISVRV